MAQDLGGPSPQPPAARINWTTFGLGAVATAVVAALIAIVGELVFETLIDIELLPKDGNTIMGMSEGIGYAASAVLLALCAAAVLGLLMLGVPRPLTFFGWIMALVAVIVAVVPFSYDAETSTQVATAVVGLVVVIATWSLLSASARRAVIQGYAD